MYKKQIFRILGLSLIASFQFAMVFAEDPRSLSTSRLLDLQVLSRPVCETQVARLSREIATSGRVLTATIFRLTQNPNIFFNIVSDPATLQILLQQVQLGYFDSHHILASRLRKIHSERVAQILATPINRGLTPAAQLADKVESEFWRRALIPAIYSTEAEFSFVSLAAEEDASALRLKLQRAFEASGSTGPDFKIQP